MTGAYGGDGVGPQQLNQTYIRNAKGLITSVSSNVAGMGWTYGYDGLDRLTSAYNWTTPSEHRNFAYDAAGNMITNSGLSSTCNWANNIIYPAQGPSAVRPHAPISICGKPVTLDANGNTLSYDVDGTGPEPDRVLIYDNENRPIAVERVGTSVTTFGYGADDSG
jgi:hypothetical protein